MREEAVEKYLRALVEQRLGGKCYKWVSPGNSGVPDRIVVWRGAEGRPNLCFVECKTSWGVLSAKQKRRIRELTDFGFKTRVVATREEVDELVEWLCRLP